MEWAIYKAEETGAGTKRCVAAAAKALRSEYPSISAEEAFLHARSKNKAIQKKRRENAEPWKKAKQLRETLTKAPIAVGPRLVRCVNCDKPVHRTAKRCPHCSYPWATKPDRQNQQVCRGCGETIPIFGIGAYKGPKQWDRLPACPRCGIRLPIAPAAAIAFAFLGIVAAVIVGTVAFVFFVGVLAGS